MKKAKQSVKDYGETVLNEHQGAWVCLNWKLAL